ncbi:hypothetical protein BV898_10682 [Hypsibius exemplaris]|uniref:Uncharacterized protein n=1 Tax=Hypsibius exemplaris TaxID=2072580 RepID=A0A1W0WJ29_HYPEX|nr:hypothetical protein BV898_10682 [Hypsibius exemplaris]
MENCACKGIALWNMITGSGLVMWAIICYINYGWNADIPHNGFALFCFGQLTITIGLILYNVVSRENKRDTWLICWLCLATGKLVLKVAFVIFVVNEYDELIKAHERHQDRSEVDGQLLLTYIILGSIDVVVTVCSMFVVAVYRNNIKVSRDLTKEHEGLLP